MSKTIKEIKEKQGQKKAQMEHVFIKTSISMLEEKEDGEKGIIEAYVSIFDNVDLGGDKIIRGAFTESLMKKLPAGVWMHNWDEPIAKTIVAREDEKGLYIKAQFVEGVQKADEAYKLLKAGVIDEFSIGFRCLDWEYEPDSDVRVIKKVKLYEWSPVLAGMNPDTVLVSVKSEQEEAKTVNFVDSNEYRVKIYYSDGSVERKSISHKYKKYILAQALKEQKREKVEGEMPQNIIKIVKSINKKSSTVLRLIKNQ